MNKYLCDASQAARILDWLETRGGLLVWESVNLANPGASWTTPALDSEGNPYGKPNWQCSNTPARHITDPADVEITNCKVVKRFHVATRMSGNGLSLKVTDAGSRRIRAEVAKAAEKTGKNAWYEFDYGSEDNCVILVEDSVVPLSNWLEANRAAVNPL